MPNGKMHADEIQIDDGLVQHLIVDQFPEWVHLPVVRVTSAGTDNALFRLGDGLVVRLPRIPAAARSVEKEIRWLPHLAPNLPLMIPALLAHGEPDAGYPWKWAILRWIDGKNATRDQLADPVQAAVDLAGFIRALRAIDATDGPRPGDHNFGRGVPLIERDEATRKAIRECAGMIDTDAAIQAWEIALNAPPWENDPVWIHGDLQSGNLLARNGRLCAVIDFGGLGVGDPACDLLPAWNLFSGEARAAFREASGVDDATWMRGKGWALSVSVIALPYYQTTNPTLAGISRYAIQAVLDDHTQGIS